MAAKKAKDFSNIDATKKVYASIKKGTAEPEPQLPGQLEMDTAGNITEIKAKAEPIKEKAKRGRKSYSDLEKLEALEAGQTSGKAGLKMPRINMAFTLSNYNYIRTMAQGLGMTMTDFVNLVISRSMEDHSDMYNQVKEFKVKF